jgi:hypothetical protein
MERHDEHTRAIAGHDTYHRSPADDRARAIFWLVVVPGFYVGLGIITWAVVTVLRDLVGRVVGA